MALYTGNIKFTATDTEPTSDKGRLYYDDSESALKHYNGDNWAQVYPINTTRPGDGQYDADAYTKLLIHSDTSNASTTFTDSSSTDHTITANGDAQHKTAQAKIGGSSIYFDGTGDCLTSTANSLSSGDWTIDCWWMTTDITRTSGNANTVSAGADFYHGVNFNVLDNDKMGVWLGDGSSWSISDTTCGIKTDWANDTWYHVALVFDGSTYKLYINGVLDVTITSSTSIGSSTSLFIGRWGVAAYYLEGYIDEFRMSSVARWTENFTVY